MFGLNETGNTELHARLRGATRLGTICGLFGMLFGLRFDRRMFATSGADRLPGGELNVAFWTAIRHEWPRPGWLPLNVRKYRTGA